MQNTSDQKNAHFCITALENILWIHWKLRWNFREVPDSKWGCPNVGQRRYCRPDVELTSYAGPNVTISVYCVHEEHRTSAGNSNVVRPCIAKYCYECSWRTSCAYFIWLSMIILISTRNNNFNWSGLITHCGIRELGDVAWRHQAITRTSVDCYQWYLVSFTWG